MLKIDFKIDKEDLQILFLKTREAYKNQSFEIWEQECEKSYEDYCKGKDNPKSYRQWVNGQIIILN